MAKANHANTTITMLDAIAPNRVRFNIISNPSPQPAKSATAQAIEKAAQELAAKGPVFPQVPKEARLPGVNCFGKITDQRAFTAAVLARLAYRKGGAL